jgi:hypothetical protein
VSPGHLSRVVVADKIALVRRMLSVTAWMLAHPDRVADGE